MKALSKLTATAVLLAALAMLPGTLVAFRNQTGRLLVYDARDAWGPVCRFLGVGEPGRAVPHLNRGAQSSQS